MSGTRAFFDTNVLLYLFSADTGKAQRAEALLAAGGVASVQVLNEFVNVARMKMHMEWHEISDALALINDLLEVHPLTLETHQEALIAAERYNFHIYDATIIASALAAGCTTLYSEDMQHGQLIAGRLRILNPFA